MKPALRIIAMGAFTAMMTASVVGCGGSDAKSSSPAKDGTTTTTAPTSTDTVDVTGTLEHVGPGCLVLHADDGVDWSVEEDASGDGLAVPDQPEDGAVIVDRETGGSIPDGSHVTVSGPKTSIASKQCAVLPAEGMIVFGVEPA